MLHLASQFRSNWWWCIRQYHLVLLPIGGQCKVVWWGTNIEKHFFRCNHWFPKSYSDFGPVASSYGGRDWGSKGTQGLLHIHVWLGIAWNPLYMSPCSQEKSHLMPEHTIPVFMWKLGFLLAAGRLAEGSTNRPNPAGAPPPRRPSRYVCKSLIGAMIVVAPCPPPKLDHTP